MIEIIQGEAGVITPSKDYILNVAKLCCDKKILLIVDEVQTGNGRTGKYFCYQHYGIMPDIVTTAKGLANGLPIGACISKYEFGRGDHASTFGGNNVACAAANATIDYIMENELMDNAVTVGNYFMVELKKLEKVKEVRGMGLMIGADIEGEAKKVAEECLKKGLLCNNVAENTIRFLPALTVSKKEVDKAIKILKEVLEK
jgi:acetylornithine/succinyldiaminopimelate/putrescine aminotransferase